MARDSANLSRAGRECVRREKHLRMARAVAAQVAAVPWPAPAPPYNRVMAWSSAKNAASDHHAASSGALPSSASSASLRLCVDFFVLICVDLCLSVVSNRLPSVR